MTIRFLRDYQGYPSGSEVSTLSTREEDIAIAAGAATRTLGAQQAIALPVANMGGGKPDDFARVVNGSLVSGDGTPIEGGGGGSTTFAGLTDKASADIPAINTPLANALAGKAASSHTHSIANVTSLQASLDAKAPLASPALTGTPTAPTAAGGTNTTQIATTAFVLANGGTALGPYADAAALETAKPAASNGGRIGLVGASAPYTPYVSNGTAWILFDNLVDPLVTIAASGTSVSQAAANLSVMDITLTGNATIAFTGIPAGAWCVTLLLKQDGTGSRLVTWPANTKWQGGVAPVLSTAAGSEDDVTLMTTNGGTTWRGFFNGKGMV